ncbi:hypothetical protein [Myxococcus xanthus]|uniref:DUF4384 domain-containing protein n=1 Tax=Myxococcus xanthus TaxID=34 RepID=A0A7Y4IMT5_MYXXA|nr:hypothetical protein [Myxococcus xanthus]NOJ82142.1 hypothetical protein [Myxococcus xanthus]NOJ85852.1 hypothetical protein [Myxococcus xanthus]
MSEHLSDLVLDEVVAGGMSPPHLESCAACRERLALLESHAEKVRAGPHFTRVRARVLSERAAPPRKPRAPWRIRWLLVPALATLATVVVVRGARAVDPVTSPEGPSPEAPFVRPETLEPLLGMRIKGPPQVELLRLKDGEINPLLQEGDEVALRLRSGGHRYALVVAMDNGKQVEALWPPEGRQSGELAAAQPAPLFQVTQGDFVVHALYSETPLRLDTVRDWLGTLKPECRAAPMSAACLSLAGVPPGVAHAAVALQVEARP